MKNLTWLAWISMPCYFWKKVFDTENTMSKETPVSEAKVLTLGKIDAWSPENDYMLNLCTEI